MRRDVQARQAAPRWQRTPRRDLFTDTHCNTAGFPGTFEPDGTPEARERGRFARAAITATLTAAVLLATFCACYLDGALL